MCPVENMSHFITSQKYVHFIYWSKKCPSKKCPGAILTPSKIAENVGDLGKIIVATGFEKLPKVQ